MWLSRFDFYQYKMTQYNSLNVKLSNLQLNNKLKSAIKNETEVVLKLSNMIGDDEINFPHKLLTSRQVSNLCKAFSSYLSTDIKLSKT